MMITEQDKKQIAKWDAKGFDSHLINLIVTPDQRSEALQIFCQVLTTATPRILVNIQKEEDGLGRIRVGERLRYHAVPWGRELGQFLEALSFDARPPILSTRMLAQLKRITVPAELVLFITPHCPHCPLLVRQMIPLVFLSPFLSLTVVDGMMFPEMAQTYGVKSVPSLFLEDDFQWHGMVSMEELLNALIQRDPVQLSQATLKNMLKEGKAVMLADLMMKHGKIFPAFLPLLTHDMWAIRLGAMVAFEQIVDQDKAMAGTVVPPLMRNFDGMDDRVKGDMIYLLGQVGDETIIPFLEAIKAGTTNHEIRESVVEALERMGMEKGRGMGHVEWKNKTTVCIASLAPVKS